MDSSAEKNLMPCLHRLKKEGSRSVKQTFSCRITRAQFRSPKSRLRTSAFTESGHSDHIETDYLTGCFRPEPAGQVKNLLVRLTHKYCDQHEQPRVSECVSQCPTIGAISAPQFKPTFSDD